MADRPSTDDTLVATDSRAHATGRFGSPAAVPLGSLIGRYVVLSPIGAGGMGVVYAAYDPELERKVALKLLQRSDSSSARTGGHNRLLREAQAMARLSHPNAITVHDVGEHAGRVYLAMELVEGTTLAQWRTAESRSWREVLEVFVAAGRGLAAAHEQGLVHRDFKPENVMVTPEDRGRRVRVMDFGLAQSSGSQPQHPSELSGLDALASGRTRAGSQAGTPAYMAPEQHLNRDVGPSTDQFSFCVALWEALYGERPFGGDSVADLAVNVTEGRLRPPPAGTSVPAWVRKVCERGLSREPAQRFPSMQALLDALQRGTARARLRRVAIGVAAVALLGAAVPIHGAWDRAREAAACEAEGAEIEQVWNDARRQEVRASVLATGLSYAEQTADRFTPWVDAQAHAWASAKTEACMHGRVEKVWSADVVDRATWCLEEHRMELDALLQQVTHAEPQGVSRVVYAAALLTRVDDCLDPVALARTPTPPTGDREAVEALRRELARAHASMSVGADADARRVATDALADAEALGWPPLQAAVRLELGRILTTAGEYEAGARELEQAYFEAVAVGATEVAAAAADHLVFTLGYEQMRPADARSWSRHAESLRASTADPRGSNRAGALENLALADLVSGDFDRARSGLERALELREAAEGAKHPTVAMTLNNLAMVLSAAGAYAEARAHLERAAAIQEEVLGAENPVHALTLANLGDIQRLLGAYAEAQTTIERALAIFERSLGPEHPDVAKVLGNLGTVRAMQGDRAGARAYWNRTLAIFEKAFGATHTTAATTLNNLGIIAFEDGNYDESSQLHERALAIREQALGPDHPEVADSLANLSNARAAQGRHDDAVALCRRALAVREHALGGSHPAVAASLDALADLLMKSGDNGEVLALYERALAIREHALGPEHPELGMNLDDLAAYHRGVGALTEARTFGERSLAIREAAFGGEHPVIAASLLGLAETARADRRLEDAAELATRAVSVLEGAADEQNELARARFLLAQVLWDVGSDPARALSLAEAARDVYRERSGAVEAAARVEVEAWLKARRSRGG